ncbi:MAG: universal stress protein [Bacillota bacterium]|nr:universal stress protein [Bacillota bacterium]
MFKKALVAIDASGPSMELLNAVDDLKKMDIQELIIVHVIRTELAGIGLGNRRKQFLENIEKKKDEFIAGGLQVTIHQPIGKPSEEIKHLAEEENADLILIGSLGEGSLVRRIFLGSTVTEVVRSIKKAVLIEKYRQKEKSFSRVPIFREGKPTTVLLATDFSSSSLHVFDTFLENPGIFDKLILISVVDEGNTEEQVQGNRDKAEAKLAEWKAEFEEKGYEVETEVAVGVASELVVESAEKNDVSLLAISKRGRSMIDELAVGSTADHIIRRSAQPVLLLRVK